MKKVIYIRLTLIAAMAVLTLAPGLAYAITDARTVKDMGIDEKLGAPIPSDIKLTSENGDSLAVNDLLANDIPTVLNLVYYSCPRLCNLATEGLLQVMNELDSLTVGRDYNVLTVSFDADDTPELAKSKALKYRSAVKSAEPTDNEWRFMTGDQDNITKLTEAVGFRYFKDGDEFAHGSALMIITPEGEVSRYLHGIQHEPADLRLSLLEASKGEIGSSKIMNQVLLFCYGFDPIGKRYALKALNIVKASGVVTLVLLCGVLTYFWRRESSEPE